MSLFQKKPSVESSAPYFTLGLETTLLIAGLGNIGKEYENTRHNAGFLLINNFAKKNDFPEWINKKDLKSFVSMNKISGNRIILAKPTTLMNGSGEAVRALQHFYKIDNSKTLIVHDEIDIDFGNIRTRKGGKAAGHNGIKSIIQHCGEDFGRVRIGIGPKKPAQIDSTDYVLSSFSPAQVKQLPNLLKETNSILSEFSYGKGELQAETRSFIV